MHDLVRLGNAVTVYYLTSSPRGVQGKFTNEEKVRIRHDEGRKGCQVLGVQAEFLNLGNPTLEESDNNIEILKSIITAKSPGLVITTNADEAHPTHRKTTSIVEKALADSVIPLWYGEVWSPIVQPHYLHFFDEAIMNVKAKALSQYKSQLKRTDWPVACRGLNRYRAITASEVMGNFSSVQSDAGLYAEAFQIKGA